MTSSAKFKAFWKAWKTQISFALVVALIPGLPLLFGIWLPDLVRTEPNILAETPLENGQTSRVIQYWRWNAHGNSGYKTEFRVTDAKGELIELVMVEEESDTRKRWRIPLVVTVKGGRAHAEITLSEVRVKEVDW